MNANCVLENADLVQEENPTEKLDARARNPNIVRDLSRTGSVMRSRLRSYPIFDPDYLYLFFGRIVNQVSALNCLTNNSGLGQKHWLHLSFGNCGSNLCIDRQSDFLSSVSACL